MSCDLDLWPHDLETLHIHSSSYSLQMCNMYIKVLYFLSYLKLKCYSKIQKELWPWPLTRRPWNLVQIFFIKFPTARFSTRTYIYIISILFELFCVEILKLSCDLDLWPHDLETLHKYSLANPLQITNSNIYIKVLYFLSYFELKFQADFQLSCDLDLWSDDLEILHKYSST